MTVKELIELLEQFDGNKTVCFTNGSSYAYDVRGAKNASLSPYWSETDEEKKVVRIALGEQIGVIG